MNTYSVFVFSSDEIDQIANLMSAWVANLKIDQRKLSKQVRKYARSFGLVPARGEFVMSVNVDPLNDLPIEALWRLVKPMIEKSSGYSIIKDRAWAHSLNLNKDDIAGREAILYKLDRAGYINFNAIGSIWRIDIID